MAVAAIDSEFAVMMAMAERHRLGNRMDVYAGDPVRTRESNGEQDASGRQGGRTDHEKTQPSVSGRRENLTHEGWPTPNKAPICNEI